MATPGPAPAGRSALISCLQIQRYRPGLLKAGVTRDDEGRLVRKAGIMGVVIAGGDVRPGDPIRVVAPAGNGVRSRWCEGLRLQEPGTAAAAGREHTRLWVDRRGRGLPFVLLHGGHGSTRHWTRNVDALAQHFEVITLDLPGYQRSPDVPKGIRNEDYVAWVSDEIGGIVGQGRRFHLGGFSFGSVLAAKVAGRHGPAVIALSLLGAGGFGRSPGRRIPMQKLPDRSAPHEMRLAIAAANLGQWMLTRSPAADDPVVEGQLSDIDRTRFDSRRISLAVSMLEDLAALTVPLQMIWGAQDKIALPSPAARAQMCLEVRPDARVSIIEGAGHWVQYEQAAAVNGLMAAFHGGVA